MNKTAIKNFAIWARNKLIADISYKAGLLGITEKGIKSPLPQSTQTVQFFDIGTKEPSSVTGVEIQQRKKLVEEIERKAKQSDYATAYKNVIEEVAYTWFNRLIAIRFMEVNNYLPTRIRVLSSESNGKSEPDLVTHALEANLDYSAYEKDRIVQLKHENKLDELFRMLFIKQCNALNSNLPKLFEKTSDYSELLLNVSFTDKEGVVYHLVNDISEDDFNVSKEGQVEIIGWLYQFYNTEPKDETFALLKKNVKITKDRIPAATQLFTPDWIVRYMVENSLGRLWIEGHPNNELKSIWKYYLDEAEQEDIVQKQLDKIREEYKNLKPEDIKIIDPAMGSGHILVYAFDVLMQIYESYGYSQREAAKSIVEQNLYGLDIDNRAYQLAYFAVMMKARQYNRRIINGETICHLYAIQESNDVDRDQLKYFGAGLSDLEKNSAFLQVQGLLDTFIDAKEYGSILNVDDFNWELLRKFTKVIDTDGQMSLDTIGVEHTREQLCLLVEIGQVMGQKYHVVITNPPYMGNKSMSNKLQDFIEARYPTSEGDLSTVFMEATQGMCLENGFSAMINIPVWMFSSSYTNLRNMLISSIVLVNMLHFGRGVFGADFGTTSFVFRKTTLSTYKGLYKRLFEKQSSVDTLEQKQEFFFRDDNRFVSAIEDFAIMPNSTFAYWAGKSSRKAFKNFKRLADVSDVKKGTTTGDDNNFLRLWHEISNKKISLLNDDNRELKWHPFNKGGNFRRWYGNNNYVVNWEDNGYLIRNLRGNNGKLKSRPQNISYFYKSGLTWTYISISTISFRYYAEGFAFAAAGPAVFPNNKSDYFYLLAFLNSKTAQNLVNYIGGTGVTYETGEVSNIPVTMDVPLEFREKATRLAKECIEISRADWDSFEFSWDFDKHPLIKNISTIAESYEIWKKECDLRFSHLKNNEEEINRLFIDIYELQDEITPEVLDKDISVAIADKKREIKSFISYAVGCIFGRYSLDANGLVYAGGTWDTSKYNSYMPDKDNIVPITDEEYFEDDITGRFVDFVRGVYGIDNLEVNLHFIAQALGSKGNSSREVIRNYFLKDFFDDHYRVYQKRPIYWLFDSGKQNGFKALIYMHRYDENTIGNLRIDYLHRMQRIYENEIARMHDTIENSKDTREITEATKRKEKLIKQLQETKEYDEKIAHLALARTSIDLDDGVKVNYEKVQTDRDGKKLDVLAKI